MGHIVVMTMGGYADIDAVACSIAYAELLRLQGKQAVAVFPGPLNHSVTPMVHALGLSYATAPPTDTEGFVIVDASDPSFMPEWVDEKKILELYDHHDGWQARWQERLGDHARIDLIGAAATLIWEAYVRAGLEEKISSLSANLLSIAIVSNSLNFTFPWTSDRDRNAFAALKPHVTLPDNWVEHYFQETETAVETNLEESLRNDTKIVDVPGIEPRVAFGQLELWDPEPLVRTHRTEIETILRSLSPVWMLNAPSMRDGRTLFFTPDPELQTRLVRTLGVTFQDNIAFTNELHLRKTFVPKIKSGG